MSDIQIEKGGQYASTIEYIGNKGMWSDNAAYNVVISSTKICFQSLLTPVYELYMRLLSALSAILPNVFCCI